MYDKNSDYALNKRRKDTIVYISVTGPVFLTHGDFATEEDFLKWKNWSDKDYQSQEKEGRGFQDNTVPLDEEILAAGAVTSAEELLLNRFDEKERSHLYARLINQAKDYLTPKQFRWLWLYHVEGLTLEEIARAEGVTHQNVSKSIFRAKKKVKKHLQKVVAKMPLFL